MRIGVIDAAPQPGAEAGANERRSIIILYLVVNVNHLLKINEKMVVWPRPVHWTLGRRPGGRSGAWGIDWSAPRRALRPFGGPAVRPRPRPARRAFPLGMGPMKGAYFMSQFYLNGPSVGSSMSAEEFMDMDENGLTSPGS